MLAIVLVRGEGSRERREEYGAGLSHRRNAGDLAAFVMNSFELLGELVERHVENAVAAGVAGNPPDIVGFVGRDLDAIRKALIACASSETRWCVLQVGGRPETPASGFFG